MTRKDDAVSPPTEVDPRDEIVAHLGTMRAFALSLTRNGAMADDLVQDTIVKAWTNFDKFEPGTNLRPWLFTILRNLFYSGRAGPAVRWPTPKGCSVPIWPKSRPMTDGSP